MTKTWLKTISSLHNCNRAYRIRMLSDLYCSRSFDHKVSIYFQYFKVKMVITRELIWKMCSHERLHLATVSMMRCVAETNVFSKSPHGIPKITNPKILLVWTMWEVANALNKNGAPSKITRGVGIFRKTKGAKKDDAEDQIPTIGSHALLITQTLLISWSTIKPEFIFFLYTITAIVMTILLLKGLVRNIQSQ